MNRCAFVDFPSREDVAAAILEYDGLQIDGQKLALSVMKGKDSK